MTTDREMGHGSAPPRRARSYRIVKVGARWTMLIGLTAFVAQFALACGSDTAPTPPPLGAGRAAPPVERGEGDDGSESEEEVLDGIVLPPAEPTETSTTFAGSLASTATVPFGGGGFCKYDITLRDIAIELDLDSAGEVSRATVRDLAVERALDNCPHAPMAPSIQDFTLKSAAVTTTGTRVELVGSKTNRPATSLVVDLVQSGAGYEATATWTRTDQTAPLVWTVTAKTSLAKK